MKFVFKLYFSLQCGTVPITYYGRNKDLFMITLVDVRLDDRSPSELCFPETITLKSGRGVFISLAYILAVHGYLINLIVTMLLIRIK